MAWRRAGAAASTTSPQLMATKHGVQRRGGRPPCVPLPLRRTRLTGRRRIPRRQSAGLTPLLNRSQVNTWLPMTRRRHP